MKKCFNENKKVLIPIITVITILVIGVTYAWLTQVLSGTKVNRIKAGTLELVLDDTTSNGINIEYAIPQSDNQGLNNTPYTFSVINNGTINAEYKLFLEDEEIEGTRLSDSNIKYSLVRNNSNEEAKLLSTSIVDEKREIESTIIDAGDTNNYSLKIWIDSEATKEEVANKVFKAKIKLEAVQTENSNEDYYQVDGYLYNENNNIVPNATIVTYSEPKYTTTDNEGHFSIRGLKYGNHTLYYVKNKSIDEVKNLTKTEIEGLEGIGKVKITTNSSLPITLNNGFEIRNGSIKKVNGNNHIRAVYTYNENGSGTGLAYTGCLGGEEAGCIEKMDVTSETSYPAGTIVKYEVKPGVDKYFNVLYDKGDTLIMQQRENTVYTTAWASTNTTVNGMTVILPALEAATQDWQYVNNQTYIAGQTVFGTGDFATSNTACNWANGAVYNAGRCNFKKYSNFTKTNVKARLIAAQEASQMGCRQDANNTCMKFMSNYLYASQNNGGTVNDTYSTNSENNFGYWTMSASNYNDGAVLVHYARGMHLYYPNSTRNGARAVVEIDK